MRNFKRTLALVLAVIMVIGTFATVSAASAKWYDDAVNKLDGIGISNIGKGGEEPLTRNEFVMWIAKIETAQLVESAWNDEIASVVFTDVTEAHHRAAIAYSYKANFIIGNGDGTFAPDKQLTLAEASAVIVRLMRFESKVTGLPEEWDMNYMSAAYNYCHAFNEVFYNETKTFHPDYKLTKGETAYILATILNYVNENGLVGPNNPVAKDDLILTADGINLGDRFADKGVVARDEVYYIADIQRETLTAVSKQIHWNMLWVGTADAKANPDLTATPAILSNRLNENSNVTLKSADGTKTIVLSAKEFAKAVRVELGLPESKDDKNEEKEIAIFDYINHGTMVNVKIDASAFDASGVATLTSYKTMTNFDINSDSIIVDTVLQMKSRANNEAQNALVGWSVNSATGDSTASDQWTPVLPSSYDASMVTTWTNIAIDAATGKATSAVLNFKNEKYTYACTNANDTTACDIVIYNKNWVPMTTDEAVNTLINAAQGECNVVFNDVDGDGRYDSAYVTESYAFVYSTVANATPQSVKNYTSWYDTTNKNLKIDSDNRLWTTAYTSMSKGQTIKNEDGTDKLIKMMQNTIGSVVYNREVTYPNGGWTVFSDAYSLAVKQTGKLQLVLVGSNMRPAANTSTTNSSYFAEDDVPLYYTVVDLAAFNTGIIEKVYANNVDGYFTAEIKCADGPVTVYIPAKPKTDGVELDVTIGGATAPYTFDSSAWFSFLEDVKADAIANGIFQGSNIKDWDKMTTEDQAAFMTYASAWMAGRYVEFAYDENNEVFCILGTDATTSTTGFVTNVAAVEKTDAAGNTYTDNTFNVSIAAVKSHTVGTTKYFSSSNPITYTQLYNHTYYCFNTNNKITVNDTQFVEVNGKKYYKTNTPLHADNTDPNAANYALITNGSILTDNDGNYIDTLGNIFIDLISGNTYISVYDIVTTEVRATASAIFDWANQKVYNKLFAGSLIDPNTIDNAKVDAGRDLIYVTLAKDGGSNYVLYNAYNPANPSPSTVKAINFQINDKPYTGNRWYKLTTSTSYDAELSWLGMEKGYELSLKEAAGAVHTPIYNANGDEIGYKTNFDAMIGYDPYYGRTYNVDKKAYEYVVGFGRVVTYTNVEREVLRVMDYDETIMFLLYKGIAGKSDPLQVTNSLDREKYEKLGYYVDNNGYVYEIDDNNIVWKTTVKDGKTEYVYEEVTFEGIENLPGVQTTTAIDVLFTEGEKLGLGKDKTLTPYATIQVVDKPSTDKGWYPGAKYLNVDGTNYGVSSSTKFVLVTPSADGFVTTQKTLAEMISANKGYFATQWNAVIGTGNTLDAIVFVGEEAGRSLAGGSSTEITPPAENKNTLVRLDASAKVYVRQDRYSDAWLVVTDKSAYAFPTGEDMGQIYRKYPTYTEAVGSINIDLSIKAGAWYYVTATGEIVEAVDIVRAAGLITDVKADGTVIATMNGVENVEISKYDTEFFFLDGNNFVKAGDNTNVKITTKTAFDAKFTDLEKARDAAKDALDRATIKFNNGELYEERYNNYKNDYANAEKALEDAKASAIAAAFDGQFWGVPNSALYSEFVVASEVFQMEKPTIFFRYIMVGDTLCVFSDTFAYTEATLPQ